MADINGNKFVLFVIVIQSDPKKLQLWRVTLDFDSEPLVGFENQNLHDTRMPGIFRVIPGGHRGIPADEFVQIP